MTVPGSVALRTGRPYVVVSADAHAAPDDLDQFLSYVDPAHREAVAAFGDLSSVAIPMFGGVDPGAVDDPDAVRAVATRRLAGMGVDTEAAAGWLSHYSSDWVFASDADGRRLAVLEDQGIHAEVTFPGPVLAGGLSPAMYLGRPHHQGARGGVARPARLQPVAGRVLCRRTGTSGRRASPSTCTTWTAPWRRSPGPGPPVCSAGSCCRPCRCGAACPATPTTTTSRCGAPAKTTAWWSTCTPAPRARPPTPSNSMTSEHGGFLGLYEVFVFTRRPLWFMIFGGVFDRHPRLKVTVTENGVQWLPSLIRDMESFFDTHGGAPVALLPRAPSVRLRRPARAPGRFADEAVRGRDAGGDRQSAA